MYSLLRYIHSDDHLFSNHFQKENDKLPYYERLYQEGIKKNKEKEIVHEERKL